MEDVLFCRSSRTLNSCVHVWRKDVLGLRSRRSATTCERRRAKRRRKRRLHRGRNNKDYNGFQNADFPIVRYATRRAAKERSDSQERKCRQQGRRVRPHRPIGSSLARKAASNDAAVEGTYVKSIPKKGAGGVPLNVTGPMVLHVLRRLSETLGESLLKTTPPQNRLNYRYISFR